MADQLFTRDAIIAIHDHSGGIPRTISVICENALISGFALKRRPIGPEIVDEVCRDLAIAVHSADVITPPAEAPDDGQPQPFSFF